MPAAALALLLAGFAATAIAVPGTTDRAAAAKTASRHELSQRVKSAAQLASVDAPTPKAIKAIKDTAAASGSDQPVTRIIGGSTTTMSVAPWMVQLWYFDDKGTADTSDDEGYFCGGSLVAPNKVLTAGHCASGLSWSRHGSVLGGTATLADTDGGTLVGVSRQWLHPSYSDATVQNDIAVLTLSAPLPYKTARLASSDDSALYTPGNLGTVYGWGLTKSADDPTADLSPTLKRADLPLVDDATCDSAMLQITDGQDFFAAGKMFCAGQPGTGSDADTTASCLGDSGGPLVVNGRIAGIVSWGSANCVQEGGYDVYTKVRTYTAAADPRINDTDLSRDGKADLFVRTSGGSTAYQYNSLGTSFAARTYLGAGWGGYNLALQTDVNRDGYQDWILRDSAGTVYWRHRTATSSSYVNSTFATGWSTRKFIAAPGDLTGDALPDLLSVASDGTVYLYPGRGDGTFSARLTVGSGWQKYNSLRGHGDFSGDGKADLLARESTTNDLYLIRGTGKSSAPFSAPVKVRSAWSGYNAFAAVGDITGDGRADFLARTSGGTLYLYPGTGQASSGIFLDRRSLGTGWLAYSIFG